VKKVTLLGLLAACLLLAVPAFAALHRHTTHYTPPRMGHRRHHHHRRHHAKTHRTPPRGPKVGTHYTPPGMAQ
jgi:hypothetical protein